MLRNRPHMLHIVQILEATTGGTRRHLRDLVLGLDPSAFRVEVIVSLSRDADCVRDVALFRARGIGVHIVPMRRRVAPLADARACFRLWRLLRRLRPDVVHTHSSKAGFIGRLAARLAGVPVVVHTPHAFAFEDAGAPLRGRCYRALERLAAHWTTRLIAVSKRERELALEIGFRSEQVAVIPNGIGGGEEPTSNTQPATSNSQQPTKVGAAMDVGRSRPPTVGFIGRLCRQKAPDVFLAAIPAMLAQAPEARFRVIGDGPWRRRIRRHVARQSWRARVSFGTARDELDVARELAGLEVLAMPSRWEGLPYTLLEALQAGVPVVAADVGGIREVAEGGAGVRLVPSEDAPRLAAAVNGLLGAPEERARQRAAGLVRVRAFDLETMVARTAAVYRG